MPTTDKNISTQDIMIFISINYIRHSMFDYGKTNTTKCLFTKRMDVLPQYQSLKAARFRFGLFQYLLNLQAPRQKRCRAAGQISERYYPISRLRDFVRFGGKTSYALVNRGPGGVKFHSLTHWSWDKIAAIFQTTHSNAFSWMKIYEFL